MKTKTLTIEIHQIHGAPYSQVIGLYFGQPEFFQTIDYGNPLLWVNHMVKNKAKPNGFTHYKYNGKRYPVAIATGANP